MDEVQRLRYLLVRLVELQEDGRDGEMSFVLRRHAADAYAAMARDPNIHEAKYAKWPTMGEWLLNRRRPRE